LVLTNEKGGGGENKGLSFTSQNAGFQQDGRANKETAQLGFLHNRGEKINMLPSDERMRMPNHSEFAAVFTNAAPFCRIAKE
jgi:hypothetical protein